MLYGSLGLDASSLGSLQAHALWGQAAVGATTLSTRAPGPEHVISVLASHSFLKGKVGTFGGSVCRGLRELSNTEVSLMTKHGQPDRV